MKKDTYLQDFDLRGVTLVKSKAHQTNNGFPKIANEIYQRLIKSKIFFQALEVQDQIKFQKEEQMELKSIAHISMILPDTKVLSNRK